MHKAFLALNITSRMIFFLSPVEFFLKTAVMSPSLQTLNIINCACVLVSSGISVNHDSMVADSELADRSQQGTFSWCQLVRS